MTDIAPSPAQPWPLWQRVLFRFFSIYLLLQIAPWNWLFAIPGVGKILGPFNQLFDWGVQFTNTHFLHIANPLVQPNGSGDTSWAWTEMAMFLGLAIIGTLLWSILDNKRPDYRRSAYWFRTIVRYYIAAAALSYGLIKIFALQMTFPTLSQLATPLGDLLPMRLSWLFIGYSTPYQMFSGVMETVAGLLLLSRRATTLGLIAALGAFMNVWMINLAYDVPVKIYAGHLLLACIVLLAMDAPRLISLLALNKPASGTTLYEPPYADERFRYARIALKLFMLYAILWTPLNRTWQRAQAARKIPIAVPLAAGMYDVRLFVRNRDTIPALNSDSLRWRDIIIDNNGQGSVGTTDSLFWQRYHRGYFRYKADTAKRTMALWRTSTRGDSAGIFSARYELPDSNSARLWTKVGNDSLFVELVRTPRHFQLTERQFHWISEYNR
ncbi:MAG: hypothetical protein ABJB66_09645 [Gemmatimonadaceae bacterium]